MADREKNKYIDAAAAERLIAAHDAEAALLAIYLALHPGAEDETAAAVLCRTRAEIAAAREKLGRILRAPLPGGEKFYPEEEPKQYPVKDYLSAAEKEAAFPSLIAELTRILGTVPSRSYIDVLLDAYEHLGMPPEVIMMLLNHCADECRRRWGETRRPTAKAISAEAYRWANREILTLELAEEYITRREKQREDKNRILALLGVRGREPSPSESKYMEAWLEMGFSDEAIAAAYDRTLKNTGALKWPYLNGILKKWHAAGLHELGQIEAAEGSRRKSGAPRGRGYGDPVDESALADFMGDKA